MLTPAQRETMLLAGYMEHRVQPGVWVRQKRGCMVVLDFNHTPPRIYLGYRGEDYDKDSLQQATSLLDKIKKQEEKTL